MDLLYKMKSDIVTPQAVFKFSRLFRLHRDYYVFIWKYFFSNFLWRITLEFWGFSLNLCTLLVLCRLVQGIDFTNPHAWVVFTYSRIFITILNIILKFALLNSFGFFAILTTRYSFEVIVNKIKLFPFQIESYVLLECSVKS